MKISAYFIFILLFLFPVPSQAQTEQVNVFKTYALPPETDTYQENGRRISWNPREEMRNNEYTVRIKTADQDWSQAEELYVYQTYVMNSIKWGTFHSSAYITFDFEGQVDLEITPHWTAVETAIIRPKSRELEPEIKSETKIYISLNQPDNLSLELNGIRTQNLQVFANPMETQTPPIPSSIAKVFEAGKIHHFPKDRFRVGKEKLIYFEPGAILRGGIEINHKNGVKIYGRGIIDQTNMPKGFTQKQKPADYLYRIGVNIIGESKNIIIEDVILNDAQHYSIHLKESERVTIKNVKIFSRVEWGDGINIYASNNVKIEDSYIRSSDDNISIYSSSFDEGKSSKKKRDTYNINIKNTSLYAGNARPTTIGNHGSGISSHLFALNENGNRIEKLTYENIDILNRPQTNLKESVGAILIICGDENYCKDFLFKDVRVEDLDSKELLNIRVNNKGVGSTKKNGFRIENIVFDNLSYNGYDQNPSITFTGLNNTRYIKGVYFKNLKINGKLIKNLFDYEGEVKFNNWVYNVYLMTDE